MTKIISIVVVNYNTAFLLLRCLESLKAQGSYIREIVIVDNNSHDDSVSLVQQHFPEVHLIASPENLGFGRANNLALKHCTGELVFLLNPDTTLMAGCLAAIGEYMDRHPEIGMAGTAIYDPQGRLQSTQNQEYPGNHYAGSLFAALPGTVAWLLGASLIVRRKVMEQVQGFDPDYFLYGEDIDLALRIRKAGWPLGFIAEAQIVHLEGQSEHATPHQALFEKKLRGELLFFQKHYSPEVVRRIKRSRRVQAFWRLSSLWLTRKFVGENETFRRKWAKYTTAARLYR